MSDHDPTGADPAHERRRLREELRLWLDAGTGPSGRAGEPERGGLPIHPPRRRRTQATSPEGECRRGY